MKSSWLIAVVCALMLAGCGGDRGDRGLITDEDVVLVLVDGQPITLPMLEFMMTSRGLSEDDHEGMREILEELIRLQAVANAARADGLDREASVRARRQIRDLEALQLRYFDQVYNDYPPTEEEIATIYRAQVERAGERQFQIEALVFSSQAEALTTLARIEDGLDDFSSLRQAARAQGRPSDGLVWVDAAQVPPDVAAVLREAAVGDVLSVPLQTPGAWRILRVVDTRDAEVPSLDEVREGIARHLVRQRLEALVEDLYQQSEITPMLPLEEVE